MLPLLRINDLSIDFVSESGITSALKNISLTVNLNEILSIFGKSVTALSILKLLASTATFTSGEIIFSEDGKSEIDLLRLSNKELQKIRRNKIAMIFQEPMTYLNPVFTCGSQV